MPVKGESTPMLPGSSPVGGKATVARFDAACMSSDGGLLALREVDQLRRDPMFKLAMGRLPDDGDPCSQPAIWHALSRRTAGYRFCFRGVSQPRPLR